LKKDKKPSSEKVEVKLFLFLTEHDAMKTYGGAEVELCGGEWSFVGAGYFARGEVPLVRTEQVNETDRRSGRGREKNLCPSILAAA
jgi:hypothetical protein